MLQAPRMSFIHDRTLESKWKPYLYRNWILSFTFNITTETFSFFSFCLLLLACRTDSFFICKANVHNEKLRRFFCASTLTQFNPYHSITYVNFSFISQSENHNLRYFSITKIQQFYVFDTLQCSKTNIKRFFNIQHFTQWQHDMIKHAHHWTKQKRQMKQLQMQ